MRLLFDQNLSPHLKRMLRDIFPRSLHLIDVGLDAVEDTEIWAFARDEGFIVATKDTDFRRLSLAFGHPPKVILIRRGNCPTSEVVAIFRARYDDVLAFYQDDEESLLELD